MASARLQDSTDDFHKNRSQANSDLNGSPANLSDLADLTYAALKRARFRDDRYHKETSDET